MIEPDQAALESLGISFHDRVDPGIFCAFHMAGECSEAEYAVSPWPRYSKFLFRNLRDCCTQLVMDDCAVSCL